MALSPSGHSYLARPGLIHHDKREELLDLYVAKDHQEQANGQKDTYHSNKYSNAQVFRIASEH